MVLLELSDELVAPSCKELAEVKVRSLGRAIQSPVRVTLVSTLWSS
jgi:hypothetical protein